MKLKNNALQELYDTIVNCAITISPYVDSPVDKAFKECDEKLSESVTFEKIKRLQNDIDFLKRSNEVLSSANTDLVSKKSDLANKNRTLEKEIKGLHKHMDILSASEREALSANKKLESETDILKRSNDALLSANMEAISKNRKLEKDLADAKNQLHYFTNSRDDWRSRAKHAEEEVKELKETLKKVNADRTELQKDRDSYHGLYTELRKDYYKLFEDNKKLKARTDCHRYEVEWYRKHYKEKSDKIKELKSTLNSIYGRNGVRKNIYDQGQTDLWVKLQNVNDAKPFELTTCFPDVTCMDDILSWDLEDFLDAYKKWWEEKEKKRLDHMRDYLARFCEGRVCERCPLGSDKFKCGCGYSFRRRDRFDLRIIPDEDIKRYYDKVCGVKPDDKK